MDADGGTILCTNVGGVVTGRHDPVGVYAGVGDLSIDTSRMTQNIVVSERPNPFKAVDVGVAGGVVDPFLQSVG